MLRRTICCLLLLLLLTACATGAAPTRREQPQAPSVTTLKVAVCDGGDEGQSLDVLIAAFQAQVPSVRVVTTGVKCDGIEHLQQVVAATEYDIIPANYWSGDGDWVDLQQYMAANGVDTAPFGELLGERTTPTSRLIALPLRVSPYLLWANKGYFTKAGIALPSGGWTWDQFRAAAARLGAQRTDDSRVAFGFEVPEWLLHYWLEEHTGGAPYEADEATVRAGLTFFQTLTLSDRTLAGPPARDGSVISFGDMRDFRAGKVPLALQALPALPDLIGQLAAGDVDLLPMPTHPGTRPVTLAWKSFYGISAHSTQPDAAFAFLKFAVGPGGAEALARAGYFPTVPTDAVGQIWAGWNPPLPAAVQTLVNTRLAADYPGKEGHLAQVLFDIATPVLRGDMSVDDAIAQYRREAAKLGR